MCCSWEAIERESGVQVVFKTGGIQLAVRGTPGESGLKQYEDAMRAEQVP